MVNKCVCVCVVPASRKKLRFDEKIISREGKMQLKKCCSHFFVFIQNYCKLSIEDAETPHKVVTQLTFTCSKLKIGTLEEDVKYAIS